MSLAITPDAQSTSGRGDARRRALLTPRLDAWALGWVAVVAWVVLVISDAAGRDFPTGSWLVWGAAGVGAMHFAMSYRLAYHDRGASIRRHPIALLYGPVLLFALIAAGVVGAIAGSTTAVDVLRSSVTIVFLLTMWHYIKQTYGVVRLAAGFAGFRLTSREALAIRYGLYPLWGLSVASYATGRTIADVDGFTIRADLVPSLSTSARAIVVVVTIAFLVGVLARASARQHRLPPATVVAPLMAAVMWVGWIPGLYAAVIMLPAFHALQYVACCYRAQHALNGYSAPTSRREQWELLQIFVAAACAGLFLTRYASPLLQRLIPVEIEPATWLLALFVFLNLHHYLIDATVWRSDGELVRAVSGRTPART